jgi:hypothetical protein
MRNVYGHERSGDEDAHEPTKRWAVTLTHASGLVQCYETCGREKPTAPEGASLIAIEKIPGEPVAYTTPSPHGGVEDVILR